MAAKRLRPRPTRAPDAAAPDGAALDGAKSGRMRRISALVGLASAALVVLASAGLGALAGAGLAGCGDSSTAAAPAGLSLVAVFPSDAGADAGCTVSSSALKVGCATVYEISGNPTACPGFDGAGNGVTATCQAICKSQLTCKLSGLSDGTDVVACTAACGSPEH